MTVAVCWFASRVKIILEISGGSRRKLSFFGHCIKNEKQHVQRSDVVERHNRIMIEDEVKVPMTKLDGSLYTRE